MEWGRDNAIGIDGEKRSMRVVDGVFIARLAIARGLREAVERDDADGARMRGRRRHEAKCKRVELYAAARESVEGERAVYEAGEERRVRKTKRERAGFTLDASCACYSVWRLPKGVVESIVLSRPQVFASEAAVCKSPSATPADPLQCRTDWERELRTIPH